MRNAGAGSLVIVFATTTSTIALAGSQSRDCESRDKSVVMAAGNSSNRIQIRLDPTSTLDLPVHIMPWFDDGTPSDSQLIIAVPISAEKPISSSHQIMHVVHHHDGSTCDGRERWDDRSRQTYILMSNDGHSLGPLLGGAKPKGLSDDEYIIVDMTCRSYGVTSPGGCYAENGDTVTWK